MAQQNGLCPVTTVQDPEKRVQEAKQELRQRYIAENVEETLAQSRSLVSLRSSDMGDEHGSILQRRRKERRDEVEGRVGVSQVSNGLQSTPAPKPESSSDVEDEGQLNRTPSFRLSAGRC